MSFGLGFDCEMSEAEMGSVLKRTLKSLCISNGWSYGIFWRFHQRNSMLLTMEDAYYEEQMGPVVDNMLLQVHRLGEGIIGRAAFTGKHRWMFTDAHGGEWNSIGSIGGQDIFQDDSEFHRQFSSGIKTIAVISVESRGVVQFGSTQKISESSDFFVQTKRLFREMENAPSSLTSEADDLDGLFASLISSGNSYNGNVTPMNGVSANSLTQSSTFISETHHEGMNPDFGDLPHLCNQMHTADTEVQFILSNTPNAELQQVFLQSTFSVNNSAANTPCISTWSNEGSILTSFEPPFPSEKKIQAESSFTSMYSTGELIDMGKTIQASSTKVVDNQPYAQSILATKGELPERSTSLPRFPEEYKPTNFITDLSNSNAMNCLSQWFGSPEHSVTGMDTIMNNNLSQSIGVTSVSSGLLWDDVLMDIPIPANSVQSSITDAFISDGQEKSVIVNGAENDLFNGLELDFGCGQAGESWEDFLLPVVNGSQSAVSTGISECVSELDVGSTGGPRKGLFSELGLEEILEGFNNSSFFTKCGFEDQLSTAKRRKTESSFYNSNQVHLASFSCSGGSINWMQPVHNMEKKNNLVSKKEVLPKSQVGLWIDDSYSINAGNAVVATPKKPEEPVKVTRKRARPGASTRPRPKDRQQIHDRIAELREIIPNGSKITIDALLGQTIKYMLFLQSVTKYADKLKQVDEPKLIGQENGVVLKENSTSGGFGAGGGATWAFEVGDQTTVCPIIVEDLNQPGQMRIEMLCEDRGFFLEIAEMIHRFGLNILKGVMEVRGDKIWAHFMVEANRSITRLEIFWSLVHLLQQTGTSEVDSTNQPPSNLMDDGIPQLNSYQQPLLPLAISVPETLQ